jgi:hypothetical protein
MTPDTLSMYRGDDRTLTITATEDMTGSEIHWTAKWSRSADEPVVIGKSTAEGITIGGPGTTATVTIDAADTRDLDPGPLYWDVEIIDTLGRVRTVAAGVLDLKADVTRPALDEPIVTPPIIVRP